MTKMKLYTAGSAASAYTWARLYRKTMTGSSQEMAFVSSSGTRDIHAETDTTIDNAEVRKNYLYWVMIYVDDWASEIRGVKVYYK